MLTIGLPKVLGRSHSGLIARTLAADPVATCLVAARFEQVGLDRAALGGQFWGIAGGREGLCFDGGNLVPISGDRRAVEQFAHAAGRRGRRCASILGPAHLVLPLWARLSQYWGPARDVRPDQPLLTFDSTAPLGASPDPRVRRAVPADLDRYYPAAVAMFTEEVGVDPRIPDDGAGYQARVAGLLANRCAFARIEDGVVVAKAEIGALSRRAAMIQGVWVHPGHRDRGLGAPLVAAVVAEVLALGRIPTLYVNDHNLRARAVYDRVGFRRAGTFASVLF